MCQKNYRKEDQVNEKIAAKQLTKLARKAFDVIVSQCKWIIF